MGITVRDVLNHRNLTQPQAIAIHAIAKAATSPLPPAAESAQAVPESTNFSVIFKREGKPNASSTVPAQRSQMAQTTLKDVVAWSIRNDSNSGVFNPSAGVANADADAPTMQLAVCCGEEQQ